MIRSKFCSEVLLFSLTIKNLKAFFSRGFLTHYKTANPLIITFTYNS